MSIHFGDKNVKEIRYGQKKVKEVWYGDKKVWPSGPSINLDPNSDQPIGRMDDGELWFRVWVKDTIEPFKIAVNGFGGVSYDWDISVDGSPVIRKQGNKSDTPILIPMPVGKHVVRITPHNGVTAGWARCLGSGGISNYRNNNKNILEFGLEWLPGYAFITSENSRGNGFLAYAWAGCTSLTFMPRGFSSPQNITSVGSNFLNGTWYNCTSLTSIPNGFNLPQNITSVEDNFLSGSWRNCTSLVSISSGFNIPKGITMVGNGFCTYTWDSCVSLTSNSPAEPINFPNALGNNYARSCFGGSCPITPDTPTLGSSVMVRRNP